MKTKKLKTRDQLKHAEILQFTRKGKFLSEYSSMAEAANLLGINPKALFKCLKGKQKTAGGYQWRYRMDSNFDDGISDIPPVTYQKNRKPQTVYQFGLDGTFIRAYPSVYEAARKNGFKTCNIYNVIINKTKTSAGYQWRPANEPSFKNGIVNIPPLETDRALKLQPVVQYNMEGKFVKEYSSVKEAAEILGISIPSILNCIRGKTKNANQCQWRLKKDAIKDGKIRNINPINKGSRGYTRIVCQFGLDGKFIREYPSTKEAARKMKVSYTAINQAIAKKAKTVAGYQWRAKRDVIKYGKISNIEPYSRRSPIYLRPVCQFRRDGTFIREYASITEAAEKLNISKYNIYECAIKYKKTCRGFLWRLKDDVDKDGKIMDIQSLQRNFSDFSQEICQFDREGKFIREYPSITEAAEKTNLNKYLINFCVMKKNKTSYGYQWRRKEEVLKNGKITDLEPDKTLNKNFYYYLQAVCQFDREGKFIREYPAIIEAAEKTNSNRYSIFLCTMKRKKAYYGYQWRRKEEVLKNGKIMDIGPVKLSKKFTINYLQAVCQFDWEGKFIREYSSIHEAANKTPADKQDIHNCANKKMRSTAGYRWRFLEEVVKEGEIMDIEPVKPVKNTSLNYLQAVCQFDRKGKFIREYPSITEAAEKTNSNRYYIYLCIMKRNETYYGYQWRLKKEAVKNGKIMNIEPVKPVKSTSLNYLQAVCQFGLDGKFIREYPSILEAASITRTHKLNIFRCVNKKRGQYIGYQWRFKKEVVKDGNIMDIEPVKTISPDYFRGVCQFDKDGKFIREYPSILDAANKNYVEKHNILRCANNQLKSTAGYQWRFKDEDSQL